MAGLTGNWVVPIKVKVKPYMGGLATFSVRNVWSVPLFWPAEVEMFVDLIQTAKSQGKVNALVVTHIQVYSKTFATIKVPGEKALSMQ